MGIYLHNELDDDGIIKDIKNIDNCFFCGQSLKDTEKDIGGVVFWHGSKSHLVLHQCCAEQLSLHLIQDARTLVSITGENCKLNESPKRDWKHSWYYKKTNKIQ